MAGVLIASMMLGVSWAFGKMVYKAIEVPRD